MDQGCHLVKRWKFVTHIYPQLVMSLKTWPKAVSIFTNLLDSCHKNDPCYWGVTLLEVQPKWYSSKYTKYDPNIWGYIWEVRRNSQPNIPEYSGDIRGNIRVNSPTNLTSRHFRLVLQVGISEPSEHPRSSRCSRISDIRNIWGNHSSEYLPNIWRILRGTTSAEPPESVTPRLLE